MRLVSFKLENRSAVGVVTHDDVIDLSRYDERLGRSLKHILRSGALGRVEELTAGQPADFALTDIDLLPPVINPNKILCVGMQMCYRRIDGRVGKRRIHLQLRFREFATNTLSRARR